jgi:GTPase involved in cell partitioning and DNA repair
MALGTTDVRTPIHRLKTIASFALLGAAVAGAASLLPVVGAALPAVIDLNAIGAVLGGLAGTAVQVIHS